MLLLALLLLGCNEDSSDVAPIDGDQDAAATDGDSDTTDIEGETPDPLIPPKPLDTLGFERPAREPSGEPVSQEEIADFSQKMADFYKDVGYFDWVWRISHGLDKSYDENMMDYKLWWQDVGMRKEGDTLVLFHHGRAENIAERTMKLLPNAIGGYLLTGNQRMADVARQYMKGMVALSLGFEFEREDPIVKYLQSRAIFNHNHGYTVDDRKLEIDYSPSCVASAKWNVHIFEIPDNPEYGDIWVSNMRSKDDIPYVYQSMLMATRAYYEADDPELREAARLYIKYLRGFTQSIVENDWYILTKYDDGVARHMYDIDREGNPEADLGSFVHWELIFGEDAECNAQLGAALTADGDPHGKGDCQRGLAGMDFEKLAFATHFFNYEIYVHFHIGAMAAAILWRQDEIAEALMDGLAERFDELMHNPDVAHRDDVDFDSAMAGWLLVAATHGYPLTADEARHIQTWYGKAADHYRAWPHWDPWNSMQDGESLNSDKASSRETVTEADGSQHEVGVSRMMELPYLYEYCASPIRDKQGVQFIDCDVLAEE